MGETITLKASDDHTFDAYLAQPEGAPKGRLVVIQEIFGVNSHMREVCDGFAADGYLALAPALFDRKERGVELGYDAASIARGRELRGEVSWDAVVKDVGAARGHLAGGGSVGIVGYCWGGSVSWVAALELELACAVGYYGGQIIEFNAREPRCPTLLHFGEVDAGIPLTDVEEIRSAHPKVEIHVYPGADHGFNCDHRKTYQEAAAQAARKRTLEFFSKHLG